MTIKTKEIIEELKTVLSSKTIDALVPPLIFVISNIIFSLQIAAISAVSIAVILGLVRLLLKQSFSYALGGLFLVALASSLAFLTKSAVSYFIPAIISSSLLLLASLISIIIRKPLAAWASHLTRGWPLEWFWRKDIKPAYREVTWFWTFFLLMRLILQIILFRLGESSQLTWANLLLGWPFTILILIFSYIYGIWRLRQLSGPSVEEFENDEQPPWSGQKKGF
ncbi:MAG: DUF3159 domain-containing protein [Halanaerobiales bacterium]|nr:DUF3159 domain-containing protein [Halanaerobiales bacterium]